VLHDITAVMKLAAAKATFVSMVAHEVRSPLAAIETLLTTVITDGIPHDPQGDHDIVKRAIARSRSLRLMVSGEQQITKYKEGDELYEVRVRVRPEQRKSVDSITGLMIPSSGGRLVRLDNLALVERGTGPAQIDRYNREHQVTLFANTLPSKPLSEAMNDVDQIIAQAGLPVGFDYRFTGRGKVFMEMFSSFAVAVVMSMIFIYMVLAAQFESFVHPLSIMSSLPLAVPFAIVSLFLTGKTLHLWSALGLLLLFGIVKKNSILQVDFANRLRREQGMDRFREDCTPACRPGPPTRCRLIEHTVGAGGVEEGLQSVPRMTGSPFSVTGSPGACRLLWHRCCPRPARLVGDPISTDGNRIPRLVPRCRLVQSSALRRPLVSLRAPRLAFHPARSSSGSLSPQHDLLRERPGGRDTGIHAWEIPRSKPLPPDPIWR
jgi:hypothetical protein